MSHYLPISLLFVLFNSVLSLKENDGLLEIIVPRNKEYDWKPISFDAVECPSVGLTNRGQPEAQALLKGYRLDETVESTLHKGFLCHVVTYKSICETNILGMKYMSQKVEQKVARVEDCLNEFKEKNKGVKIGKTFPSFKCQWLSEQEESIDDIILTDHSVRFDVYRNVFVDGLFPDNVCKRSPCTTNIKSVIWLEYENRSACNLVAESFIISKRRKHWSWTDNRVVVFSSSLGYTTMMNSCFESVCGEKGIRLGSGQWFQVEDQLEFSSKLKNCEENSSVAEYNPFRKIERWTLSEFTLLILLECQNSVERAKITNSITPLSMSLLTPNLEGVNKAYRINNKILEMATVDYITVVADFDTTSKENYIGTIKNTLEPYYWDHWVNSGKKNVLSGFNGLMKTNGTIQYPMLSLIHQRNKKNIVQAFPVHEIPHPEMVKIMSHYQLNEMNIRSHYEGRNVFEGMEWLFNSKFWSIFMYSLLIMLFAILFICLLPSLKKLSLLCFRRRRTPVNRENDSEIEMNTWSNLLKKF